MINNFYNFNNAKPYRLLKSFYNVNVAGFYLMGGNKEKALKLNQNAISELKNTNGWKITTARCYKNLGETYYTYGEHNKAIESFELAKAIFKEKNKLLYIGICNQNIGNCYFELKHYQKALVHLSYST